MKVVSEQNWEKNLVLLGFHKICYVNAGKSCVYALYLKSNAYLCLMRKVLQNDFHKSKMYLRRNIFLVSNESFLRQSLLYL